MLNGEAELDVQEEVSFHGNESQYSEDGVDARQKLTKEYLCKIMDGAKVEKE